MNSLAVKDRNGVNSFTKREIHFEEPVCHINIEFDNMGRHKNHPQPLPGCHNNGQYYSVTEPLILCSGIKRETIIYCTKK